jgi:hypothetical protein
MARLCQPSTLRMLICPEASSAQNNMAAVSADGSTICVLILRLNSSCNRSIAFVELIYDCPRPAPMMLMLNIHYSRASDIVVPDQFTTSGPFPYRPIVMPSATGAHVSSPPQGGS